MFCIIFKKCSRHARFRNFNVKVQNLIIIFHITSIQKLKMSVNKKMKYLQYQNKTDIEKENQDLQNMLCKLKTITTISIKNLYIQSIYTHTHSYTRIHSQFYNQLLSCIPQTYFLTWEISNTFVLQYFYSPCRWL